VLFAVGAAVLSLFGCAVPGVPVTRQATVPRAITDLAAKESSESIVLSFTLPKETIQGHTLAKPPAIEVYRAFQRSQVAGNASESAQPHLVTTVPSQMVDQYREGNKVRLPDLLAPTDFAAHVGGGVIYTVRTRLGKHDSGDSNAVHVQILPAPQSVADLHALITKTAVELSWTAAAIVPVGSAPPISLRYSIYRAETPLGKHPSSTTNFGTRGESSPFTLVAESSAPSYNDTNFMFGQTYAYFVRSVATYKSGSVESDESNVLNVTPRDTFAPATPENVAAAVAPANGSVPTRVDLSWAISSETDLLGYNVYRSDTEQNTGTLVNAAPLLTPTFRDESVAPGKQYFYRITAVDRSGNESPPSEPVKVTVPGGNGETNFEKGAAHD
jgi:hypothetical protein